jgi:hypothetical protein
VSGHLANEFMKTDKVSYETVLKRANEIYCAEKTKNLKPEDMAYWAPEMFPKIESNQVKSMLKALVEEMNK